MPKRRRVKVVIDTNVFIANFLSRDPRSHNRRVIRLWLIDRSLKLALSRRIREEYLKIFDDVLGFDNSKIQEWRHRFGDKRITETVDPGISPHISRDPKDDIFLAAAIAARAKFLITNDRDLLEISGSESRGLRFRILTPKQFLDYWDSLG